jgi:hypothetical protein
MYCLLFVYLIGSSYIKKSFTVDAEHACQLFKDKYPVCI